MNLGQGQRRRPNRNAGRRLAYRRGAHPFRIELLEYRVVLAGVTVSDATIVEGDAGSTALQFVVTRTGDPAEAFTVNYSTTNDTASATISDGIPTFHRHNISTTGDDPQSIAASDVDSDGDLDVVSAYYYSNLIAWHENDGNGNFTTHVVTTAASQATAVAAADMDGDGDTDIIGAWWSPDTLAWFENDGSEHFSLHGIAALGAYAYGIRSLSAVDVDGDSDLDILTTDDGADTVAWYENNGIGMFSSRVVSNTADGAKSASASDVDGDGDMDIVSASSVDDTIAWYENNGSQTYISHPIDSTADFAYSVFAADLDGDGDTDVLAASFTDKTVAWHENDGAENFTKHVLTSGQWGANSVSAADMDLDGDLDVVFTAEATRTVGWFDNDGAENFILRVIGSAYSAPNSAVAADIDVDGDPDILVNLRSDDTVAWYENSRINPEPADFQSVNGTLNFAPNQLQKTVTVGVLGDIRDEDDEKLYLTFENTNLGIKVRAFGTLLNEDDPAYVSIGGNATVMGVPSANEDILVFNKSSGVGLFFDGSDVGLGSIALDGFDLISTNQIVMSFSTAANLSGVGAVDPSDLVLFTASSLGANTTGAFSMYFDGSDVGLTSSAENVDGVHRLDDGRLLVSTTGNSSVPGVSGDAADLLAFIPASLGGNTTGTWALYFDASDVGLAPPGENVDALTVDASGRIYLSTTDNFSVTGASGADEDVFVFTPTSLGATTTGSYRSALFLDGSLWGLAANDVTGINIPVSPASNLKSDLGGYWPFERTELGRSDLGHALTTPGDAGFLIGLSGPSVDITKNQRIYAKRPASPFAAVLGNPEPQLNLHDSARVIGGMCWRDRHPIPHEEVVDDLAISRNHSVARERVFELLNRGHRWTPGGQLSWDDPNALCVESPAPDHLFDAALLAIDRDLPDAG